MIATDEKELTHDTAAPRLPLSLFYLFLALTLAIAALAYHYYRSQKDAFEHEIGNQLAAIADLKVRELSEWRQHHIDAARLLSSDTPVAATLLRVASGSATPAESAGVRQWMEEFCRRLQFASATLTDRRGDVVLSVGHTFGDSEHMRQRTLEVFQQNELVVRDFHLDTATGDIHLGVNLPLRSYPGSLPEAAVLLGIDPRDDLYPTLQRWPVLSDSGETLLARREEGQVVFLNELRFRKNTALRLRFSLTRRELPIVQAILGGEGLRTGPDYRGVPVFAVVRRIPDTPWYLLSKVDAGEATLPVHRRSALLIVTAVLLILVAGAVVVLLWRRQQLHFYRAQYRSELERRALIGHYDYLTRFANDIIILSDASGRIVEVNDRAVATYGYNREELLTMSIRDLRHPSHLPTFDRDWYQSEERKSLLFETIHRARDGRAIPVEASVRVIEVEGKKFRQSIVRDISERKVLDERLRRTFDTLTSVVESSPAAILSLDANLKVTSWNHTAEQMFGWTADEAACVPAPFIPPKRRERAAAIHARVLKGETINGMRAEGLCKDGRTIQLSLAAAPLHDSEGHCTGVTLNLLDVTERAKAEEALQESESRFRRVVEIAPDAILLERSMRVLYVNAAAVRLFGAASAQDLLSQSLLDRIHPDERAAASERSAAVARSEQVPLEQRRILTLAGEVRFVECTGAPIAFDNRPASLVFLRDVTEARRNEVEKSNLEEQLRQAQKMESLGRLAGGVAHDFNNHLTVIAGYCDMLLHQFDLEEPARQQLEEIRAAGQRATSLTQQLLTFSRKQIAERKPLNLNDVVAENGNMLRRLMGAGVEIIVDLDARLGMVVADRGQMGQVLMNLAINARDAMPNGGRIVISTASVELPDESRKRNKDARPGRFCQLSVHDEGTGMSPETLQHIFEPFFTTKGLGVGTGLGLATVYGIVQQSHGWINVESQPGQGSTFRIYLPQIELETPVEQNPPVPSISVPRGAETVLVVDDQSDVRRMVRGILADSGYQVLEAPAGGDALRLAESWAGPIHLLVTDVVMPGMTGRELARQLTAKRPSTRVLFISGYTADALSHDGLVDPELEYLPKPFTAVQLAVKVRDVLGDSRPPGNILVVDDDEAIRRWVSEFLTGAGYHVLTATEGKSAMRLVRQHPVDAVVTDLIMPGQEGIETIQALHREYPGVKIVAMTGAENGAYLKSAAALGAHATLPKPFQSSELLRVLHEMILHNVPA